MSRTKAERLQRLPADLKKQLPAIRDRWIDVGLRTGPGDPPRAWAGIREAYSAAGLDEPKRWLWMRSPLELVIACALLRLPVRDQVGDQVLDQVYDQVREEVYDQVLDQVHDQVLEKVRAQVHDQVRDHVYAQVLAQVGDQVLDQVGGQVLAQVSDQVYDQVHDQVLEKVRAQVYAQVREEVRAQVSDQVYAQVSAQVSDQVGGQVHAIAQLAHRGLWWWYAPGQFDSYWLSYCDAFKDYCDFDRLKPLVEVAESCAWAWTFPDIVAFCAPPVAINRDNEGRLHCEDGAAVLFADGWGVWAWHGVRVPQRVIEEPGELTVAEALVERNAEVRRVMLLRIGPERIEREGGLKLLDEVADDQVEVGMGADGLPVPMGLRGGRLYELPSVDGIPAMRWVSLVNSTAEPDESVKRYFLRVPPTMSSVREAVAWTFGVEASDYVPVLET